MVVTLETPDRGKEHPFFGRPASFTAGVLSTYPEGNGTLLAPTSKSLLIEEYLEHSGTIGHGPVLYTSHFCQGDQQLRTASHIIQPLSRPLFRSRSLENAFSGSRRSSATSMGRKFQASQPRNGARWAATVRGKRGLGGRNGRKVQQELENVWCCTPGQGGLVSKGHGMSWHVVELVVQLLNSCGSNLSHS